MRKFTNKTTCYMYRRGGVFKAALIFLASLFIFSGFIACSDDAGGDDNNWQPPVLELPATWYGNDLGIDGIKNRLTLNANADYTWEIKGTLDITGQDTQEQVLFSGTFEKLYDSLIEATVLKAFDESTGDLIDKTEPYEIIFISMPNGRWDEVQFNFEGYKYSVTLTKTGVGAYATKQNSSSNTDSVYKGVWWNETDKEGYAIDDNNMDPIYYGLEKYYYANNFGGSINASSDSATITYQYMDEDGITYKDQNTKNLTLSVSGDVLTTTDNRTNESKSYTKLNVNKDDIISEQDYYYLWTDSEAKRIWEGRCNDAFYEVDVVGDLEDVDPVTTPTLDEFSYIVNLTKHQKAGIGKKINSQNCEFTAPEHFLIKLDPLYVSYEYKCGQVRGDYFTTYRSDLPKDCPIKHCDTVIIPDENDPTIEGKRTILQIYETTPHLIATVVDDEFGIPNNRYGGDEPVAETPIKIHVPRTTQNEFKMSGHSKYVFDFDASTLKIISTQYDDLSELEGSISINALSIETYEIAPGVEEERYVATFNFTPVKYSYETNKTTSASYKVLDRCDFNKSVTVQYHLSKNNERETVFEEEVLRDENRSITDYFYYMGILSFATEESVEITGLNGNFTYNYGLNTSYKGGMFYRDDIHKTQQEMRTSWEGSFNDDFSVFTGKIEGEDQEETFNFRYEQRPYYDDWLALWAIVDVDGTTVEMRGNSIVTSLEKYFYSF